MTHSRPNLVGGTLLLAALTTAACRDASDTTARDTVALGTGALETASAAGTMDDMTGGLSDANIVYLVDQANVADSTHGALAATRGTRADVRKFGEMMMAEHHALRVEGQSLASRLGVTAQAPDGDQSASNAEATLRSMREMARGAEWDRAYLDHEIAYHTQVLETVRQAARSADAGELRALLTSAIPVIERHLQQARALRDSTPSM